MAMVTCRAEAEMESPNAHRDWAVKPRSEGVYSTKLTGTVFSYTD